jgi:hypothetical protein
MQVKKDLEEKVKEGVGRKARKSWKKSSRKRKRKTVTVDGEQAKGKKSNSRIPGITRTRETKEAYVETAVAAVILPCRIYGYPTRANITATPLTAVGTGFVNRYAARVFTFVPKRPVGGEKPGSAYLP